MKKLFVTFLFTLFLLSFINVNFATDEVSSEVGAILKVKTFKSSVKQLKDFEFANLISHILGSLPQTSSQNSRNGFPNIDPFNKPKVNLLLVSDSLPQDSSDSIDIMTTQQDSIAMLTSMFTGTNSEKHQIYAKNWENNKGNIKQAFSFRYQPATSSIVDLLSQLYKGRSLIFSASSDYQLAAVSSPHFLTSLQYSKWNNFAYYYNENTHQISTLIPFARSDARMLLNDQQILEELSHYISQFSGCSVDKENKLLKLEFAQQIVELNLNDKAVWKYAVDIVLALRTLDLVSGEYKSLLFDDYSDFIAISFSSLNQIKEDFGESSSIYQSVVAFTEMIFEKIESEIKSICGRESVAIESLYLKKRFISPHNFILRETQAHIYGNDSDDDNDDDITPDQLAAFHICLWSSIVLVLTLYTAIYAINSAVSKKDTMLFSTPVKGGTNNAPTN
eukprot:TRINITY_DN447_c1_g1_i1.p1 TRINITY_DN447_c1_g1~~TRINITY_DN447_c1_g1_i1.p1  ORF type:complete len:448 (+),score=199.70 TRINITY_DN447_c1_g1_i1:126-1469(+)